MKFKTLVIISVITIIILAALFYLYAGQQQQTAYFNPAGVTVPINYPLSVQLTTCYTGGQCFLKSSVSKLELLTEYSSQPFTTEQINFRNMIINSYGCSITNYNTAIVPVDITSQWQSFNGQSGISLNAQYTATNVGYYIITDRLTLNNGTCFVGQFQSGTLCNTTGCYPSASQVQTVNVTGLLQQIQISGSKPQAPTLQTVWFSIQDIWSGFWTKVSSFFA